MANVEKLEAAQKLIEQWAQEHGQCLTAFEEQLRLRDAMADLETFIDDVKELG